ncbi:MAG: PAS domain S-box protein, partial [Pyrinomonadaceae bacterium]|nr:PAS domain S-box protein [Pyrinomonadaceae bacterium]
MERITRAERLEQELAQSEARLRESEDRYRQMFEKNRAIKLLIAPESGQIIDANPAACEFYGYPRAEFQTKNIKEINTLSAAEVDAEMARAAGEQRAYFVFRHRLASGAVRDVEVYSSPIEAGGRCLLYSIINDITERKQAEQALRSNVQLFRTLVENAEDLITIFNRDWTIRYESPAVEKMLGFKPSELRGRHLLETVHPCDRRAILRAMKYKTEHPGELVPVKGRIRHKDGSYRILEGRSVNLLENPAVGGIVANTRDVTERERAEAALRESEEKFRLIVETTNEWIWSMDREGRSIYDNPAVEMLLGYSPDELRGRDMSELMHEEDRRMMEQQLPAFFAAKRGWTGLICRYRHKDGSYRYLESNAAPVLDARGELAGYRGADRDVTDRVRAQQALSEKEEQLRQAQKMEAIGQLAGGV